VFHTDGLSPMELLLLLLYTILFSWICMSFWTAFMGFFVILFGRDRWAISRQPAAPPDPAAPPPRTAILMPIYNEDSERVFAGLRAIHRSLADTGQLDGFDFFILSDTRDPDVWVEEELRWQDMVRALDGKGRIFYRNRPENTSRKSGNLEDFCTRWGGHYRYMIVLDADSIMKGETLVEMVRLMERHPGVALIQTPPVPVNRESLFARILQFASSIYGRMFTAGLNYWQLGESNYWGHNAIIRVQPFLDHCGLPKLPGREPFGGEILSHDFVEAALLRRAGWEVWLAYDLEGSYEEIPPTLIDYAKRDRRWCQGNLQHSAAGAVARFQRAEPAAFRDGGDVLRRLAAVAAVPDRHRGRGVSPDPAGAGVFLWGELDPGVAGIVRGGNDHGAAGDADHAVPAQAAGAAAAAQRRPAAPRLWWHGRRDPERGAGNGVLGADRAGVDAVSDQVRAGDPDAPRGRLAAPAARRPHDQLQGSGADARRAYPDRRGRRRAELLVRAGVFLVVHAGAVGLVLSIPVSMLSSSIALGRGSRNWGCS
jgi:hypothetical protein